MTDQLEFPWEDAAQEALPEAEAEAVPKAPAAPRGPRPPREEVQRQADALWNELTLRTGLAVQLHITNNRSTMMSIRYAHNDTVARVSLHHMFLTAPPRVRTALVAWVKNPRVKAAGETLNAFIRERRHQVAPAAPRRVHITTRGRNHDLRRLFDAVNAAHFDGAVKARITWGRMTKLGQRRHIRFGSFQPGEDLIRIHPLLDQPFVPEFYIRFVVFHEMLHAHLGIEELPSGRRSMHGKAFRQREKAYPDYDRATQWEQDPANMKRLLGPYRRVEG